MTHSYERTRDTEEFITHVAYEEINRQVAAGRPWAKCVNCGNPYPLDRGGCSADTCSNHCFREYMDYLNAELRRS